MKADILKVKRHIIVYEVDILLDTGSALNFVSHDIGEKVETKRLKIKKGRIVMADGSDQQCNQKIEIEFNIESFKTTNYKVEKLNLSIQNKTIILGTKFLLREEATINYKEEIIDIDGTSFEIPKQSQLISFPETQLIQKSSYLNTMNSEEENIKIQNFKEKILTKIKQVLIKLLHIGSISKYEHEINLKDSKTIYVKPYPIPYNIRDDVRKELKGMIRF